MSMKVVSIADLLDTSGISRSALDDALVRAAPAAIAWCDGHAAALSRSALRDQLIEALPDALDVGLPECIVRRWARWQPAPTPVPADLHIDLALRPEVDLMHAGMPATTLALHVTLWLEQALSTWGWVDGAGRVQVGEARAWQALLSLEVADAGAVFGGRPFFERRCDVFLPPGPWESFVQPLLF